ncbi:unnamed protein product [Paramecium sonneborni]|uniref:Cyclic nucleotide-binding domain-containing protein n=1 Tax=Paramecium sonneborni TaxID=65129 RepID=A0A8S1PX46_9CILI|nr:unnamed protein product [Paramecium sonneborni]
MNSQLDDVLHKTQFTKIAKNSPKFDQDECLEPPSFFESFFLDKSGQSSKQQIHNIQDQINRFLYDNCNQWADVNEPTKTQKISQNKSIQIKNQEIKSATQIAFFVNCMLTLWNNIFNAFFAFLFPYIVLLEGEKSNTNLCYFLLYYIFIISLTYTMCLYIQIKNSEKQSTICLFDLINYFTIINIFLIVLLLIFIILNIKILAIILSFYFFYEGYNQIEMLFKLLVIQKKKQYKYMAILKIIIYYIYLLHLLTCLIYQDDFQLNYRELLLININFFTFQVNYYTIESTSSLSMILSQIVGLIMLFKTIDTIIQIRLNKVEIYIRPYINLHILHYYIWNHQGKILEKLKIFSQLANSRIIKKQISQNIMKNIFQQIIVDYLEISQFFSTKFILNLSERIKVLRKIQEIDLHVKSGLYMVLSGEGLISNKKEGLKLYEQNKIEKVFGLIDCFQKNVSDQKLTFYGDILVLYVSEEDFRSCLNSSQDIEKFHMIKNKIQFEGDTSDVNYRCLICKGYHLMMKCQVQKDVQKLILMDYNVQNERQQWNRRKIRKQYAYEIYLKKLKQQISVTASSECDNSEDSSDNDKFQIYLDDLSESQKFIEKNLFLGNSKGTITIPTISKEAYGDFISEKILLEQLKQSHKQISIQPSLIQPGSQQLGDCFRGDIRSQQLHPSLYKFQDILGSEAIDSIKEYVYFYPEFNISSIISQLHK